MASEFQTDGDFEAVLDHVLNAEPELIDKVTAGDTELQITATEDANMKTFKQAVRVAVENAPDEPHHVEFVDRTAHVTLE